MYRVARGWILLSAQTANPVTSARETDRLFDSEGKGLMTAAPRMLRCTGRIVVHTSGSNWSWLLAALPHAPGTAVVNERVAENWVQTMDGARCDQTTLSSELKC